MADQRKKVNPFLKEHMDAIMSFIFGLAVGYILSGYVY